jgi:hypothetical protein
MANKWLTHVKKTMKQMKSRGMYKKGDGLKKVILAAKKTYKKGGALLPPGPPVKPGTPSSPTPKDDADDKIAFSPMKVRKGGVGGPESEEEIGGRRRKTRRRSSRR